MNPAVLVPTPSIGLKPDSNSSTYTPGDKYSAMLLSGLKHIASPPSSFQNSDLFTTLRHHRRCSRTGIYDLYDPAPITHAFTCVIYRWFSSHQYCRRARCPGCCCYRYARLRSQNSHCGRRCRCHLWICHGCAHSKRHNIYHRLVIRNACRRHIAALNLRCRKNIQCRWRHSETAHELRSRCHDDRHVRPPFFLAGFL